VTSAVPTLPGIANELKVASIKGIGELRVSTVTITASAFTTENNEKKPKVVASIFCI
jgi:hypothetical protein